MQKFITLAMVVAFAINAFAQDVPKKTEIIPPSEATAPAESNIPVPEQKPEPAKTTTQPAQVSKGVHGKKRTKPKPAAPRPETEKK